MFRKLLTHARATPALVAVALLAGCQPDDTPVAPRPETQGDAARPAASPAYFPGLCSITIDTRIPMFAATGGTLYIQGYANDRRCMQDVWTPSPGFQVSLTPDPVTSGFTVAVALPPNPSSAPRIVSIPFMHPSGSWFDVIVAQQAPLFPGQPRAADSVAATSASASSITVPVTAPAGSCWVAVSSGWATPVNGGSSGCGNGTITLQLSANGGSSSRETLAELRDPSRTVQYSLTRVFQGGNPFTQRMAPPPTNNDVPYVQTQGTLDGRVWVGVLDGPTGLRTNRYWGPTGFTAPARPMSYQLVQSLNAACSDLAIFDRGSLTGYVQVAVYSCASGYRTQVSSLVTRCPALGELVHVGLVQFDVDSKPDLWCVLTAGTGSGRTELHVLSGASNYTQFILQTATAFALSGTTARYALRDTYPFDGKPELWQITERGTVDGRIHVSLAAGYLNYQGIQYQVSAPVAANFPAYAFTIGRADEDAYYDIYTINRNAPTSVWPYPGNTGFTANSTGLTTPLGATSTGFAWLDMPVYK